MTNAVTGTWLALVILIGSIEQQHLARTTQRIDELTIGNTEADVTAVLGAPVAQYEPYSGWSIFAIGQHPKQWCYGTRINLDEIFILTPLPELNLLPLHLRWFGYSKDDWVIKFDEKGTVTRVLFPEVRYAIDHRFDSIFHWIYTVHHLALALNSNAN